MALQGERTAVQKSLRVVDQTGRGDEPTWNLEKLRADLDVLLKRVKIAPRAAADASEGLESVAKGGLAAARFLADMVDAPEYALEVSLAPDDIGMQEGWYWQCGTLEVRLVESADERVRGTKRWPVKACALVRDVAVKHALDQVDTILKKRTPVNHYWFRCGSEHELVNR